MKTRDAFQRLGIQVQWARQRVILHVGKERHKIVCSPPAFRVLDKLVKWALEAGFTAEEAVEVVRGSGRTIHSKAQRAEERLPERTRLDFSDDVEPEPEPLFNPAIDDEFRNGSIILDGIGFYPRPNERRARR